MRMTDWAYITMILMVIGVGIVAFIGVTDEENLKSEQTVIEDSSTWSSIE